MASYVQLPLFDASALRRRRRRQTRADNATQRRRGRLVVAGGLVVDEKGRVMLLHRATPVMTWWETPGGKLDRRETPRDAAIREFAEELGVHASIVADLGWHDFESGSIHMRYALYQMKIVDGVPEPLEDEFDSVGFFSWGELIGMRDKLSPNAQRLLDKHVRGHLEIGGQFAAPEDDSNMAARSVSQMPP